MSKAFIWDLDGTLLDSYPTIVSSIYETYREFGIETSREEILRHSIRESVSSYIQMMEKRTGRSFQEMKVRYSEISGSKKLDIPPMKHAREILERLTAAGARNFVYTHRGVTTPAVLENLGFTGYFEEVVTSQSGFPRKPAPDAITYLAEKYGLDQTQTYYVGDRAIDMVCARNAGINGILYLPEGSVGAPTGVEKAIIKDLLELAEYMK